MFSPNRRRETNPWTTREIVLLSVAVNDNRLATTVEALGAMLSRPDDVGRERFYHVGAAKAWHPAIEKLPSTVGRASFA
jgi:hypothetical protein